MSKERMHSKEYIQPIQSWFYLQTIPSGQAPSYIREQWIDIPLPLRYAKLPNISDPAIGQGIFTREPNLIEDHIRINPFDGVKSLKIFERNDAAKWWEDFIKNTSIEAFIFNNKQGFWLPNKDVYHLFPIVQNFDKIQFT